MLSVSQIHSLRIELEGGKASELGSLLASSLFKTDTPRPGAGGPNFDQVDAHMLHQALFMKTTKAP